MLTAGKSIKTKNDKLSKITIDYLFQKIKKPKPEIVEFIEELRFLAILDPKAYSVKKTDLPYVVPSIFKPLIRRTEYFVSAKYLILDIDKTENPEDLKHKIRQDQQAKLIFISPSGKGLKIFFELDKPCFDPHKYSYFYKIFAEKFAEKFDIISKIDLKTRDVTRACFISYDPKAFFNPNALKISIAEYVDFNNKNLLTEVRKEMKKIAKEQKVNAELDKDTLSKIKEKLNPEYFARKKRKQIYVPPELENIQEKIIRHLNHYNISIKQIQNINYGKKFVFQYEQQIAEVNVFYGKRGFTVVKSPKSGTNKELMEIGFAILNEFFEKFHSEILKKQIKNEKKKP